MGQINVNYTNGGIGGVVSSTDFISGFIFDSTVLPAGFTTGTTALQVYSIKEAETIGIVNTSIDETKATGGTITIISGYTAGDVISVSISPAYAATTVIGTYTVKLNDTVGDIASGLTTSITLSANKWTGTALNGVITLVAPVGLGASINGAGVIGVSTTGSLSYSTTNFSGGAGSQIDIMHYILSSYFAANPNTKAWINVSDFTSGFNAEKIKTIQTAAQGEIRQLGIWTKKGLDGITTIVNACNTAALDQTSKHKPLSIVIGAQKGTATLATLANLRSLTCPRVSVTIGNAYGDTVLGYNLIGKTSYFPTDLGEALGHISRNKVSNSIAWVQVNLTQNADTMLVTGEKWIDIEDSTRPSEITGKGYIYERKYQGFAGSYFDNDAVCDSLTSDYDSIKRVRTMDKVARISYTTLVPYLSSPLIVDPVSGTLSQPTIDKFTNALVNSLTPMVVNAELSGYQVYINPAQNVLTNKELVVAITLVPVGSVDTITVNLGYALSLS